MSCAPTAAVQPRAVDGIEEPTCGDLQMAILALGGIFWALDMLVVQGAANEICKRDERENGIASLIMAGERLAKEVARRF